MERRYEQKSSLEDLQKSYSEELDALEKRIAKLKKEREKVKGKDVKRYGQLDKAIFILEGDLSNLLYACRELDGQLYCK